MTRRNVENVIGRLTIDEGLRRPPRFQKAALFPLEKDPADKAGRAS